MFTFDPAYLNDNPPDFTGQLLFYSPEEDELAYDVALEASDGTLLYEGDVAGRQVYLVTKGPKRQPGPNEVSSTVAVSARQEIDANFTVEESYRHEMLTTEEYLDELVGGDGANTVIVIDCADEFFTLDGPFTVDRLAEWASANGALVVLISRATMPSATIH